MRRSPEESRHKLLESAPGGVSHETCNSSNATRADAGSVAPRKLIRHSAPRVFPGAGHVGTLSSEYQVPDPKRDAGFWQKSRRVHKQAPRTILSFRWELYRHSSFRTSADSPPRKRAFLRTAAPGLLCHLFPAHACTSSSSSFPILGHSTLPTPALYAVDLSSRLNAKGIS